jgi:1-acyl-sn-glycerol-3-phosphate acyltransferase
MLRGIIFFIVFIPWTLFIIITGVPVSFIRADYLHNYAKLWAKVGLMLAGVRLSTSGLENLEGHDTVIYMGNHQSNFDILSLFVCLPGQFRWIAKEELFRIPLFGYSMKRSGYIPLNRSDRRKALQSMKDAAARIAAGTSVVIFPEGTRSENGELLPFKKGSFSLAKQAGVPIAPFAITGSCDINPKGKITLRPGQIHIRIFPTIAADASTDDLMEAVRSPIAEALGQSDGKAA